MRSRRKSWRPHDNRLLCSISSPDSFVYNQHHFPSTPPRASVVSKFPFLFDIFLYCGLSPSHCRSNPADPRQGHPISALATQTSPQQTLNLDGLRPQIFYQSTNVEYMADGSFDNPPGPEPQLQREYIFSLIGSGIHRVVDGAFQYLNDVSGGSYSHSCLTLSIFTSRVVHIAPVMTWQELGCLLAASCARAARTLLDHELTVNIEQRRNRCLLLVMR